MLIWIEGSVDDYPLPLNQDIANALIELGEAGYKARHVIACPRNLAKHFAMAEQLSVRSRAYFNRFYAEFTQLGRVVSQDIQLVASLAVLGPAVIGGVWRVPLHYFAEERYTEELTVICENDTDYEIYECAAKAWVAKNLPGCVVASRSRAGGGGSTATVVRRMATDPNPIYLCLLDSDRNSAGGAEGSTARGVRNNWRESWRAHLYVMTARELENILPIAVVRRYMGSIGLDVALLDEFSRVHPDLASYVCLKTGETVCRFHLMAVNHGGYERTREALRETARRHPNFLACGESCAGHGCATVPTLGERFLESFAGWLRHSYIGRVFCKSDHWHLDFESAASLFGKMGLALPRRQ